MNKILRYILLTPIHIIIKDFVVLLLKLIRKYPKFSILIISVMMILSYLSTPNLFVKKIETNENVLWYPYWDNINTEKDLQELQDYAKKCIAKKDYNNLIDIFEAADSKQSIYISQNTIDNSIYIITNKYRYQSDLFIYRKNDNQYVLDKHIWFFHLYKIGNADFDEENDNIYLGVLTWSPNEGNLNHHSVKGYSLISYSEWERINKIVGKVLNYD